MINNFEDYTHELTEKEKEVLLLVSRGLEKRFGKAQAITNKKMCIAIEKYNSIKITGPRMRKIINAIRMSGKIERLVASSKGYYIENDMGELSKYIESLHQRAESIFALAKQLDYQRKSFINNKLNK